MLAAILTMVQPALVRADSAPGGSDTGAHTLGVELIFPDMGLAVGEELCVMLFPGSADDLATATPIERQCAGQGTTRLFFEQLDHGEYKILVPAPGSVFNPTRYQGQVIDTDIPDDPDESAFGIPVTLGLTAEAAGTTGIVEVTVYGCPPGTNGGGDATAWESKCTSLIGGTAVELAGIGSIDDTSAVDVTAAEGDEFGRVKFSNLPAGAYEVIGDVPAAVSTDPTYFVESSISGGIGELAPDEPLAVRPAEVVAVDVFLVLDDEELAEAPGADANSGNPDIAGDDPGVDEPEVTGGLAPERAAATPVPEIN